MLSKFPPDSLHTAHLEVPVYVQIVPHEPIITAKPAPHPVVILGLRYSTAVRLMPGPIQTLALQAAVAGKLASRAVFHPVAPSHLFTKQLYSSCSFANLNSMAYVRSLSCTHEAIM